MCVMLWWWWFVNGWREHSCYHHVSHPVHIVNFQHNDLLNLWRWQIRACLRAKQQYGNLLDSLIYRSKQSQKQHPLSRRSEACDGGKRLLSADGVSHLWRKCRWLTVDDCSAMDAVYTLTVTCTKNFSTHRERQAVKNVKVSVVVPPGNAFYKDVEIECW